MQFTDEWLVPSIETLLSAAAVQDLRQEAGPDVSLWEMLVQRKQASDQDILGAIATRFRFAVADLSKIDVKLISAVPEQLARRFNIVPVRQTDSYLEVATANPFDIDAEKMLAFATGREVRMLLGSPSRIREKLDELYRETDTVVSRLLEGIGGDFEVEQIKEEEESVASEEQASQRPILRLVDMMIADGVTNRASDIHVEPIEGGVVIRYRIDGVLRQAMKIPRTAGIPLVSRVKIMSGLDIADRLRPQDGRARVLINGEAIDLRVSTLPASLGEKVVIRILNQKATSLSLDSLGMADDERTAIRALLSNKEGIILVTGPTGSGKTTTLYSALRVVQGEGVNIVTVEDPVEYRLGANIVQVQVNEKAGLTFASALRSILRQDPDVVLIGEIRDKETAQIALQASLTGHLVLSTLHTNDAPKTLTRLIDMGVKPYAIASSVSLIIAQRLARRLCSNCKEPVDIPAEALLKEGFTRTDVEAGLTIFHAKGCNQCTNGYKGRVGIYQVMPCSETIGRIMMEGGNAMQIAAQAKAEGVADLRQSGLKKVKDGLTSLEEINRVTVD
jgi:type IV pilus assembly protein PilB